MSKVFKLGVYRLGDENIRVYASANYRNSSCRSDQCSGDMPLMCCKLPKQWGHTVAECVHEAMEWSMLRRDCCWVRHNAIRASSDAYSYTLDHGRLDDVAGDVGMFITDVLPELAKAWKKSQKTAK